MRGAIIRLAAAVALLLGLAIGCGGEGDASGGGGAALPTSVLRAIGGGDAGGGKRAVAGNAPAAVPTLSPTPAADAVARLVDRPAAEATVVPAAIRPTGGAGDPALVAPLSPPVGAMTAAYFPAPPERDLLLLAQQLRWRGPLPTPTPGPAAARPTELGGTTDFWVLDYPQRRMARRHFRLAGVSEHAYWWVDEGLKVADDALRQAMDEVETQVYPRVRAAFGGIPEIDAGGRGHIITARIPGLGGYVSGADPYPSSVNPYSNEAPAIYINGAVAPPGSEGFASILAHELQHAIHWYADRSEEGWLNEGLAELAVTEAGYNVGSIAHYLQRTDRASLVNWPKELGQEVGLHYGASALFAHYLREHYAPGDGLQRLLAIDADGIAGLDAFLSQQGAVDAAGGPTDFHAVFADWVAANLLDRDSGKHGYGNLDIAASATRRQKVGDAPQAQALAQYAVDYVEIDRDGSDAVTIHFAGDDTAPLLPGDIPGGSCWWSNRGDSISSTLTRRVRVPPAASAAQSGGKDASPALSFRYWHDIETDWDYLYVMASGNDGATWDVLPADGTTASNPLGNGYGHGYTGNSDGWQDATASLAAYAGQQILARFHYVTDDAIHGPGFCVREMRVTGGGGDNEPAGGNGGNGDGGGEWRPEGFVLVNNRVQQSWIVWVIDGLGYGERPATATRMTLRHYEDDGQYTGTVSVPAGATAGDSGGTGRVIVAVSPVAPATTEAGSYRVWSEAGGREGASPN